MRNHKYEKVALKNLKNNQFKAKNVNIGRSGFNNNSVSMKIGTLIHK